jgi:hypothetical protein
MPKRIGLVHALQDSIVPVAQAMAAHWPEADFAHLFDGSLYLDRSRGTATPEEVDRRVRTLLHYSASTGVDGILFTGSFFGAAVRKARAELEIPVLTSYDGLVEAALAKGSRFWVLATAADSVKLLEQDLAEEAARAGVEIGVQGLFVPDAMEALLSGDRQRHDELVAAAAAALPPCDAILLAQFSMAPAQILAAQRSRQTVLTAPDAGVQKLRRMLG